MKKIQIITFLYIFFTCIACSSNDTDIFNEIYELTVQNNYFKARELFDANKTELSESRRMFIEAVLKNAFNKPEESEGIIETLIHDKFTLPDSLHFMLYETRYDNEVKLYQYKKAKQTIHIILSDFREYLDKKQFEDYENSLKIWTALEHVPAQKTVIKDLTSIRMEKDVAGLNNLKIHAHNDSLNFIFDTGANLSTTSQSIANQLNMKIIPVDIQVGTITGDKVSARLAVCDTMKMGNICFHNVVFLVMADEALSFPQVNYQIYGILGFPVIEAMKEIRITQNGDFIVPLTESVSPNSPNMAMKGLTPLIYLNNKHFTFDTGADKTMLYHRFYMENQDEIDSTYHSEQISFAGAGGKNSFDGFNIDYSFNINGTPVLLENITLIKEQIDEDETVYGNIGQDLIGKSDTMTINFNEMFISFSLAKDHS